MAVKNLNELAQSNCTPKFEGAAGADPNWRRAEINTTKWNGQFPYQLRIVKLADTTKGYSHESRDQQERQHPINLMARRWDPAIRDPDVSNMFEPKRTLVPEFTDGADVYELAGEGAVYTLPIPPESIDVTTPYAIQTSITLGGSIEEHNGAPIRMITLSGSFGVTFGRGAGNTLPSANWAESIFGGTLGGVKVLTHAAKKLVSTAIALPNIHSDSEYEVGAGGGPFQARLTGYYQARVLQNFLESYVELKKSGAGGARGYRLAFCMWKDEAIYFVSPQALHIRKAANSPLEYLFSLQLKATKRLVSVSPIGALVRPPRNIREPGLMAQILDKIEDARDVIDAARNTMLGAGSDIAKALQTVRILCAFVKDALGLPQTARDVYDQVLAEWERTKAELIDTGKQIWHFDLGGPTFPKGTPGQLVARPTGPPDAPQLPARPWSPIVGRKPLPIRGPQKPNFWGDDFDPRKFPSRTDPLSPKFPDFIRQEGLAERARARAMTPLDFQEHRATLQAAVEGLSRTLGVSHPTFETTRGLKPFSPDEGVNPATDEDFAILFALNNLIQSLSVLTINNGDKHPLLDTLATMAGLAERSGIAFQIPRSKYSIPFPYGSTLEMLAQRYLGTPDRWHEIAALNGLRTPFVDEVGTKLPLLVNGEGSSVIVDNVANLFVGKTVWIGSTSSFRTRRVIEAIQPLTPSQYLVTVDGDPDMDRYFTIAGAYLFAFASNTVNSQQTIFIPSDINAGGDEDFRSSKIPGLNSQEQFLAVGGVDLLLTPTGDLVVTPDGDTRWAVGLTNITQKIRLALSVRTGTLLHHPEYGLPIEPGMSVADVSRTDLVRSLRDMFRNDPTFSGVSSAQVNLEGPVARLSVGVEVRGIGAVIPVSLEVRQ